MGKEKHRESTNTEYLHNKPPHYKSGGAKREVREKFGRGIEVEVGRQTGRRHSIQGPVIKLFVLLSSYSFYCSSQKRFFKDCMLEVILNEFAFSLSLYIMRRTT